MSQTITWLVMGVALVTGQAALATELALLDAPVKVTATLNSLDEGGYAAQIGVHNGPITQLVHTVVHANTQSSAERQLRKQVLWRAPYLFVHASCGGDRTLRCEGEAVFKVVDNTVVRLGDLIGNAATLQAQGHFLDVYDKLDGQFGPGIAVTPSFVIALDEANNKLMVNAAATWSSNTDAWRTHAELLANAPANRSSSEIDSPYFVALISNASLARYCNKTAELQALLSIEQLTLSADQLRVLNDALAKVVPLELPREWRKPY